MPRRLLVALLLRDEVLRQSAHGVKTRLVGGVKEVLQGGERMTAELRLPDRGEAPVGAEALH